MKNMGRTKGNKKKFKKIRKKQRQKYEKKGKWGNEKGKGNEKGGKKKRKEEKEKGKRRRRETRSERMRRKWSKIHKFRLALIACNHNFSLSFRHVAFVGIVNNSTIIIIVGNK